jgi:hypothetical protein
MSLRLFELTLEIVVGTAENYAVLEEITSVFLLLVNLLLIVTLDDEIADAPVAGL